VRGGAVNSGFIPLFISPYKGEKSKRKALRGDWLLKIPLLAKEGSGEVLTSGARGG